ncbi:MAG: permease [Candidatus Cloacimonetes bacterium]|nr:permease [Candidatus Cloacimonadota bacterium]MCF7814656.1 permease [Candidatus Cloacimonadota bacterium]MCF7869410.1 permease [Candidatus Cloacimonadota bacterium]MCF7884558.1 permease [Candidatus Cloacimonadota bacterium]
MNWKNEWKILLLMVVIFLAAYHLPVSAARFQNAVMESFHLLKEYARLHVILCLIPALFIAGAIGVFISQNAVMKYLGARAKRVVAYSVASVSGAILAVCSCTILPLFSGIYKRGAGLGPATAFLYSGPAINILAIILTARILGVEMGIARAVGAIVFSIVIGIIMGFVFRKDEQAKVQKQMLMPEVEVERPFWHNLVFFASMIFILIFANWAKPATESGIWNAIYSAKWIITSIFAVALGIILITLFKMKSWKIVITALAVLIVGFLSNWNPLLTFVAGVVFLSWFISRDENEMGEWFTSTWDFAKQILPLLFFGVIVAGLLLARPGQEGLIPSQWISKLVGGNSIWANFFASIVGAFMYFATLTEVPILQGLMGNGMGKGPALALLLAGPALSLPNMLVIRSVMGTKKTVVFVSLVVVMATITGVIFGAIY